MSRQSGSGSMAEQVRDELSDDLLEQASEGDVDVDSIISNVLDEYPDMSLTTHVRFARSNISTQIEAAEAESLSGLIVGSRDRYGKNWPRRISLVRSNGDHVEASTWSGSLPVTSGGETEIPNGAAVDLRCEYDSEYDSWEAEALDSVDNLDVDELASRLSSVAVKPDELSRDDEYEVVVVEGTIDYVNPQTVFEDGEPIGPGEVLMPDEDKRKKPHMEIVVDGDENTRVRGHFERMRYGDPVLEMPDSKPLLEAATEQFTSPDEQASFLMDAYRGANVVMVGNVNSVDTDRQQGQTRKYVDIALSGVVDVGSTTDDSGETVEQEPSDPGGFGDGSDDSDTGAPEATNVETVKEDIEQYAELTGTPISSMDADFVDDKIAGIDAPDSVIEVAIGDLTGDDDSESTSSEADDGGESDDGEVDLETALEDDGMYVCPAENCIGSAPSIAALCGHVAEEHRPDDSPKTWLESEV